MKRPSNSMPTERKKKLQPSVPAKVRSQASEHQPEGSHYVLQKVAS